MIQFNKLCDKIFGTYSTYTDIKLNYIDQTQKNVTDLGPDLGPKIPYPLGKDLYCSEAEIKNIQNMFESSSTSRLNVCEEIRYDI